jgi:predicted Holliday junction resolvase-like endonuclease
MDPVITSLLTEASKLGFGLLLLAVVCYHLVKWVRRLEDERKARDAALEEERQKREEKAAARCKSEIDDAIKRIQFLENREHSETRDMLNQCMEVLRSSSEALRENAESFRQLLEIEKYKSASGTYRTIKED